MILFIFALSHPFPTYFGLKWSHKGVFEFFWIFLLFFGIFYYSSGKDETKRYFLFSLFLILFQPILVSNEAIKVFFNFLNFFAIFLEFSFTRRIRRKWNDIFYLLFFSAFPTYIGFKWSHEGVFKFFEFFWYFFGVFSITCRVMTKRKDNFHFLSVSWFPTDFGLK